MFSLEDGELRVLKHVMFKGMAGPRTVVYTCNPTTGKAEGEESIVKG